MAQEARRERSPSKVPKVASHREPEVQAFGHLESLKGGDVFILLIRTLDK